MRIYSRRKGNRKGSESNIPNLVAFTFIRNFLTDKNNEKIRREYLINNLNTKQVNQAMKDIKWLFREYKDLDVVTIQNEDGDITKFIL